MFPSAKDIEPMPRKTTTQQAKFIEAMSDPNTKNQTQAAIKAGCPPKTARITASKWLTKANILDAIDERKKRVIAHSDITPEEIIGGAAFQMRSSIDDLLDENGSFSIEKARATGAVDLLKRHKETKRTVIHKDGTTETVKTVQIEILTNQDGRKELAEYIGLDKLRKPRPSQDEHAIRIFKNLMTRVKCSECLETTSPTEYKCWNCGNNSFVEIEQTEEEIEKMKKYILHKFPGCNPESLIS